MIASTKYDGIDGVKGYEPIGVALTIGIKPSAQGFPIEKDRFHLMEPREGVDKKRARHPSFDWFNNMPIEKRRVIPGVVAHGDWSCLEQQYRAYRSPNRTENPAATSATFCHGDAITAERFIGAKGPDDFRTITCPAEACQYRKPNGTNGCACKPTSRFLFRLDWHEDTVAALGKKGTQAVNLLCQFTTGSWHTYKAIRGLRDSLDAAAISIGLVDPDGKPIYSPLGFRFTITLTETSKLDAAGERRRFHYCYATALESPVDFLAKSLVFHETIRGRVAARLEDYTREDHRLITGPELDGK